MSQLVRLFLFSVLVPVITSLQWANPGTENAFYTVCVGDDLVLPWNVTENPGESIDDITWIYKGDHSEEMVAFFGHNQFQETAPFAHRVEFVPNAGIVVKSVGLGDRGNYSVEVILRENGRDVASLKGKARVQVAEPPTSSDDSLHVMQEPDAVKGNADEWAVQLTCGSLSYPGDPSVADSVEWVTPSGTVIQSSSQVTDNSTTSFALLLENPVEGGQYMCRLPNQHPATSCLSANSSLREGSSIFVDEVKARLSLIEVQQRSLKNENVVFKTENLRLKELNTDLTKRMTALESVRAEDRANLTQQVDNLRNLLKDYSNFTLGLQRVQETLDLCSCGSHNDSAYVSFHAQLGTNKVVQTNQALVLPDVQLNQGNAYNTASGVFTVPYDGVYFFLITSGVSTSGKYARLYIIVDNREVGYASAHYASTYGDTGSGHSVVHLSRGQRVWLRSNGEGYFWGAATAFSGVLLNLDE